MYICPTNDIFDLILFNYFYIYLSELLYLTNSSILVVAPFNDAVDVYNHSLSSLHLALNIGYIN